MKQIALFILGFLVMPLVPFYAIKGNYPWWMVTPDDPVSPFGMYEEDMRKAYKYGRWFGDVVWLAFRNRMFGLSYHWKPEVLKGVTDYSEFVTIREETRKKVVTEMFSPIYLKETIRFFGPFQVIYGHRVSPLHDDKDVPRKAVNMDGRPTLSIRMKRNK